MKKVDFDLGTAATSAASRRDLQDAERVMKRNKRLLQASGVIGIWIGARASKPYIMVAVNQHEAEELKQVIPDCIEGVSVYYVEGIPTT